MSTTKLLELIDVLQKFAQSQEQLLREATDVHIQEATILLAIINELYPVMRFVDHKIITKLVINCSGCIRENFIERGIIIAKDEHTELWLTRTRRIYEISYDENTTMDGDISRMATSITEITVHQAVEKYDFWIIMQNIGDAFTKAIITNENKYPIVRKRYEKVRHILAVNTLIDEATK